MLRWQAKEEGIEVWIGETEGALIPWKTALSFAAFICYYGELYANKEDRPDRPPEQLNN